MLTRENYFSKEMNLRYMSVSQFKSFMQCEAGALAEINGEVEREKSVCLLVGSYVDSYFSNNLDLFKAQNPEIFLKGKVELKSEYNHADYIIERIERDPMMMKYLSGEKQVIKTGEIEGVLFKSMIDSYHIGKAIVDLKIVKDLSKMWKDGLKLSFVEFWKYDFQASVYCTLEGNNLPFFIAAATKEKPEPDLAIISIPQERLDFCLDIVKQNVKRFDDIKKGLIEPTRCEQCSYCRKTKVLTQIISYEDIGN